LGWEADLQKSYRISSRATTAGTTIDLGIAKPADFKKQVRPAEMTSDDGTQNSFSVAAIEVGSNWGVVPPLSFNARPWVVTFWYTKTTDD
jgi:hypothetical protein